MTNLELYADQADALPLEAQVPERLPTPREKLLFAPLEGEPDSPQDYDYDYLFSAEDLPRRSVEHAAVRTKPRQATPESEAEARNTIGIATSNDPMLNHLLAEYLNGKNIHPDLLPKALRSDADLRLAVGMHLADQIARSSHIMPFEVRQNRVKNPHTKGYDHIMQMKGREYSALLALGMLDGTFKWSDSKSNPIAYDFVKDDGIGQHRLAAMLVLGLHRREN